MRFQIKTELLAHTRYLKCFLDLIGKDKWHRRIDQLAREMGQSPFLWKIVSDYNWFELAIAHEAEIFRLVGTPGFVFKQPISNVGREFVGAIIEIHERLSPLGKRNLEGRLRDALKADSGLAPLFLEINLATRLVNMGWEVGFPDLEGLGRVDLTFSSPAASGEIECKTLSVDAGRSIHRRDFYRFIQSLGPLRTDENGIFDDRALLVTLKEKFSARQADQDELRVKIVELATSEEAKNYIGPRFNVERKTFRTPELEYGFNGNARLYELITKKFGKNCHVAAGVSVGNYRFVIIRSLVEDDPSKPILDSIKKAKDQFSKSKPSFVAIQYNELNHEQMALPHVQERAALITNYAFGTSDASHVNAAIFFGFRPFDAENEVIEPYNFACLNPVTRYEIDLGAFLTF